MQNAKLDEAQAGIKIAGRSMNNLRHADDTTLMAENEEELKNILMKVKEESEKSGLKLNIQKTNIMASSPTTSWQIVCAVLVRSDSCDPMDCSPPSSSVHGNLQARILEWVTISFSSWLRDQTHISCIAGGHIADGFFTDWTTREVVAATLWDKLVACLGLP